MLISIIFLFYLDIQLPEKVKLAFKDKVPQLPVAMKPPKSKKRLELMRGPEPIHNKLIHQQYGIMVQAPKSPITV